MGNFVAALGIPDHEAVLSGYARATNTVAPAIVLTIPAGRTWVGTVTIQASNLATTASVADTRAVVTGQGAGPPDGTVIGVAQGALNTSTTVVQVDNVCIGAPLGNPVTINIVNSTGTTFVGGVSCYGYLVR